MSQRKQSSQKKSKSLSRGINLWLHKPVRNHMRLIVILALIGVLLIPAGWLLQRSGLFSMHAKRENSCEPVISELMSDNLSALVTESGEVPDWIEIHNPHAEKVEIGRYALMLQSGVNRIFSFPEYTMEPGEYLLVYADGLGRSSEAYLSAPFRLPAGGNDTLMLINAYGETIDSVLLPELDPDHSYARQDDGSWLAVNTPSPGSDAVNSGETTLPVIAGEIEITEAMSANTLYTDPASGIAHDYIEIRNLSGENVSLGGWYLSDSIDKLRRWSFPDVDIPAGGYLLVYCTGENSAGDANQLYANFKLSSGGETLYLSRPNGQTASMVELPALQPDQAYSLAGGEWTLNLGPTPGMENTAENAAAFNHSCFSGSLRLSELSAAPDKQPHDWVEIHNAGGAAVDLSGYGLSDNTSAPRKWQFPAGTLIQPGEYLGVLLSGSNASGNSSYLNADFSLALVGCYTLCLSDPEGKVLDAIYVPRQYGGVSYGRALNGGGLRYYETETPMAANDSTAYLERAEEASVSVSGGLFDRGESFSVALQAPEGSRIYYTLDCSDPDESATPYTSPIPVSDTTVIRSRVYRDGCLPSYIDTQSYLFDVQAEGDVYVVSVVSDMDNLSGDGGLLTDYLEEIATDGHVEVYTLDGECAISQGCELSLHGADSRKKPIKSFNVIARSIYGDNRFDYPLFSHRDYQSYHSFLLRPSGEDQNMSFMRDSVLTSLMRGSSVMFQEHEVAVMYLNGLYYSMCYVRERINEQSICQFEGWEGLEDDIDLIKLHDTVTQGSNATFESLLNWVKNNDTTTEEAYQYIDARIDIQNYIEYMALQIFVGNTDTLNVRRYRCDKTDGKWRWALYDLDWAFYNDTNSIKNWLTPGGTGAGKRTDNTLFIGCMKNPRFCEEFLTHFAEQMATTFCSENVMNRFAEQHARLSPLLPQFREQWGFTLKAGTNKVIEYTQERPAKILNFFKETFNFSNAEMQEIFGDAIDKINSYESKK